MRMRAVVIVALAASLLAGVGGSAEGKASGGVKGVLLNTTCPEPCVSPPPPPPPCPPCGAGACPERPGRLALVPCPLRAAGSSTQQSVPYTGPDAHVAVRRASDDKVVARRRPSDGHFRIRLAPGVYRVHGYVAAACWHGETKQVTVHATTFAALQLSVYNACVVTPASSAGLEHRSP